jgi:type I restriction enzyme S subunit
MNSEDQLPKGWKSEKIGNALELIYGNSLPHHARLKGAVPVYGSNGQVGFHNLA